MNRDSSGQDEQETPALGRYPAGAAVPAWWQGLGGDDLDDGRVYQSRPRRRALTRLLWFGLITALVLAGVGVVVAMALLRILVL